MLVAEHVVGEPLRSRVIRQPGVEQSFDHRLAPRERVADDDAIEVRIEPALVVALLELDAELLELRAHRRVDVLIRARDFVAGGLRDRRDAAHERAADAEDVNPH
jgi:hypothetical protein